MEGLKYTVIKNRKQYNDYCKQLDALLEADELTSGGEQEVELLTLLIETWDAEHNTLKDLDPVAIIHSLMKEHELTASDLTAILDISKSYLSEVLSYKKGLSKDVIRKLAAHFKMAQEAFNRPYVLRQSAKPAIKQAAKKSHKITSGKVKGASGKPAVKANRKKKWQAAY